MINIECFVPHKLGKMAAMNRVDNFLDSVARDYHEQVHHLARKWDENLLTVSFDAYGIANHWLAKVVDTGIELTGEIPESAARFRERVEQTVVSKLTETLNAGVSLVAKKAA